VPRRNQQAIGWVILSAVGLCLVFAEVWLVEADYYAVISLSTHWWLAVLLTVLVVLFPMVLWLSGVSDALTCLRDGSDSPVRPAAVALAFGAGEVVVSVIAAVIALVLLGGFF